MSSKNAAFENLSKLLRKKEEISNETCDLCGLKLAIDHEHLIDPTNRKIICSCTACAILFNQNGDTKLKYSRIHKQIKLLSDFYLNDSMWDSLMVPVGMVFFYFSSAEERVSAFYPGPAGVTESLLTLATWEMIVDKNPILEDIKPDIEALLINRVSSTSEYYIVPIDECFKLAGLIRTKWRGLSGGEGVWNVIEQFFTSLRNRSIPHMEKRYA